MNLLQRIYIGLLLTFSWILHASPSYAAYQEPTKHTKDYLFNNFKCGVELNAGIPLRILFDKKSYFPPSAGVQLGYHLFKFQCKELVRTPNKPISSNPVKLYRGEGIGFLEIGIHYPERELYEHPYKLKDQLTFKIDERFLVFPISFKVAWPGLFEWNAYRTLMIGFKLKYLFSSKYIAGEGIQALPDSFHHSINDLKTQFKELKKWEGGIFLGVGMLFPFGLYMDALLCAPFAQVKNQVKVNDPENHILNQDYIQHVRGHYSDNILAIKIGFDFFMMAKNMEKLSEEQWVGY